MLSAHQYSLKLLAVDQKSVKSQRRKLAANAIGIKHKKQRKEESRRMKHGTADDGDWGDEYKSTKSVVTSSEFFGKFSFHN